MDQMRNIDLMQRFRNSNLWIRELCRMGKGLDERIDEGVLSWFGNVERME